MSDNSKSLGLLAIGAHPDDVELFSGGAIARLTESGVRVTLLDLTRGECGTRGSAETRKSEAEASAKILGIDPRLQLDLGDGKIYNGESERKKLVEIIRQTKPHVVLTHGIETRHPDHSQAHQLVRDACFLANVGGYDASGDRHRVEAIVYFPGHERREPIRADWIVDITSVWEKKMASLKAYATQFFNPGSDPDAPKTYLSSPEFWEMREVEARRWGHLIGVRYAEPYLFESMPHDQHPFIQLFRGV